MVFNSNLKSWLGATAMALSVSQVEADTSEPLMIAHAGGGLTNEHGAYAYTNSIEALNSSYQAGFRFIEIDFSWTSDQRMVCLHDWEKTFKKLFGYKIKAPLSYAEFEQLVEQHDAFQVCTLETLAQWLANKPDVFLITDIKYHNQQGLQTIAEQYPELVEQIIPQIYQPEEYPKVKAMGYEQLIWILYQYKGSKQSVLEQATDMELLAVSMRAAQARNRTLRKLQDQHRVFVYTINKIRTKDSLVNKYGVSGIYTDFLAHE